MSVKYSDCPDCGTPLAEGTKKCWKCGFDLTDTVTAKKYKQSRRWAYIIPFVAFGVTFVFVGFFFLGKLSKFDRKGDYENYMNNIMYSDYAVKYCVKPDCHVEKYDTGDYLIYAPDREYDENTLMTVYDETAMDAWNYVCELNSFDISGLSQHLSMEYGTRKTSALDYSRKLVYEWRREGLLEKVE